MLTHCTFHTIHCAHYSRHLMLTHCTFHTMPIIWEFHVFILLKSMLCHILLKKVLSISCMHVLRFMKSILFEPCVFWYTHTKDFHTLLLKMVMQPGGAACTVKISHKICVDRYIYYIYRIYNPAGSSALIHQPLLTSIRCAWETIPVCSTNHTLPLCSTNHTMPVYSTITPCLSSVVQSHLACLQSNHACL